MIRMETFSSRERIKLLQGYPLFPFDPRDKPTASYELFL